MNFANLLANRPAPRGAAGGAGGDPPAKAKILLLKYLKKEATTTSYRPLLGKIWCKLLKNWSYVLSFSKIWVKLEGFVKCFFKIWVMCFYFQKFELNRKFLDRTIFWLGGSAFLLLSFRKLEQKMPTQYRWMLPYLQSIHFFLNILRFNLKIQLISHIIIQKLCNLMDFWVC